MCRGIERGNDDAEPGLNAHNTSASANCRQHTLKAPTVIKSRQGWGSFLYVCQFCSKAKRFVAANTPSQTSALVAPKATDCNRMEMRAIGKLFAYRTGAMRAYHFRRNTETLTVLMFHRVLPEDELAHAWRRSRFTQ